MDVREPPVEEASYEPPFHAERSSRRGLMRLLSFFAALVLLAAVGALYARSLASASDGPSVPVSIVIPEGASTARIAKILEEKKVIKSAWLFKLIAKFDGRAEVLKPGEYKLRTGMSFGAVLAALEKGPEIVLERFTIPEGKTIREIVDIIRTKTNLSASKFQAEIDSGRHRLPIMPAGSKNLEGLLFPKTYQFPEGTNEEAVLRMLLDQFTEETSALDFSKARGLTPYQVIVMASLVEREAKVAEERPKIAAVIYNRIARKMRLQIDATVQYAILQKTGKYKPRLTFADYDTPSPYNTYQIDGLPPAPIASPGLASIMAVLEPASIDSLYYVLCDPRGGHAFARTAEEHNRNRSRCLR